MDLAFTFTYLILRCVSSEVEICALSISIRQGALGRPAAAMEGVEKCKRRIASNAANNTIGFLNSLEYVATREDGKSQGSPRKLSTT